MSTSKLNAFLHLLEMKDVCLNIDSFTVKVHSGLSNEKTSVLPIVSVPRCVGMMH